MSTPRPHKLCQREGCTKRASRRIQHEYCTFLCRVIDREISHAQRACEALGNSPLTNELWSEVVALSDAWTRFQELNTEVYRHAKSVGFTDEQWQLIWEGKT
jgi:hypothetical protein